MVQHTSKHIFTNNKLREYVQNIKAQQQSSKLQYRIINIFWFDVVHQGSTPQNICDIEPRFQYMIVDEYFHVGPHIRNIIPRITNGLVETISDRSNKIQSVGYYPIIGQCHSCIHHRCHINNLSCLNTYCQYKEMYFNFFYHISLRSSTSALPPSLLKRHKFLTNS
jgi:hypothetical protein